jgi:ABC-type nickel/cobalt efflux system permease component RcnA
MLTLTLTWADAACCPAALLIMFFLEYFDMLSGGALGALTVGLVTCYTWEHGQPHKLSRGPSQSFSADVERVMAVVSALAFVPLARLSNYGSSAFDDCNLYYQHSCPAWCHTPLCYCCCFGSQLLLVVV